ncbi:MAG: putative DNA binding domain-containing protein, partial [Thermodesulfobacteriota bacterium]|nr:putative DNA binding domain-containing protein [Thermodesulfobacteriota bacterium]
MKPNEFKKLIAEGENENTEFKTEDASMKNIARAVCGFFNGKGGKIFIGVDDQGSLTGVKDAGKMIRQIERLLPKQISPHALWNVEQFTVGDKVFVMVDVPQGTDKPYLIEGSIFVRKGAQTVPATRDDISSLIQRRTESSQRWERQIAMGAGLDDLDDKLIYNVAGKAAASGRWRGSPDKIEEFLYAHGLSENGWVTRAALLLFGKQPTRLIPQARVRLVVMPEGKTGESYLDDQNYDGCILRVADQIKAALEKHTSGISSSFLSEKWQRDDRVHYPKMALREGIMNALVHRDYSYSGEIMVMILSDSLRISNPGGLPAGLKLADLKREHPSIPRNPDIAHICYLDGLIEKIGRGTQRIMEECRKARLRAPKWQSSRLETALTFYAPSIGLKIDDLNERQLQILSAMRKKDRLRSSDITDLFGENVTGRTIRNDLKVLLENDWLARHGRGRGIFYTLGPKQK